MRIKNLPKNEMPLVRLKTVGETKLSGVELLSLIIRTGVKNQDAIDIAKQIFSSSGGIKGLEQLPFQVLDEIYGIGPTKAAAIRASFELGRRLRFEEALSEKVDSPENVIEVISKNNLFENNHEKFIGLLLNSQSRLIHIHTLSEGDIDSVNVSISDVIREILLFKAIAVVFIHNHPSDNPYPSREDEDLTINLMNACELVGIQMKDHIIYTQNGFYSFRLEGRLN